MDGIKLSAREDIGAEAPECARANSLRRCMILEG
jgi:hypothetical protein